MDFYRDSLNTCSVFVRRIIFLRVCAANHRVHDRRGFAGAACIVGTTGLQSTPRAGASKKQPCVKESTPSLRVDTCLVLVPLTVTGKLGPTVVGLQKKNFRALDDNVEQTITHLAMEDDPVAVGFGFDISGSIGEALGQYRMVAREFFKTADNDGEFLLVEFESSPRLVVPLTKAGADIEYQIMMTKSEGMTALFDGVYLAANEICFTRSAPLKGILQETTMAPC